MGGGQLVFVGLSQVQMHVDEREKQRMLWFSPGSGAASAALGSTVGASRKGVEGSFAGLRTHARILYSAMAQTRPNASHSHAKGNSPLGGTSASAPLGAAGACGETRGLRGTSADVIQARLIC
jgi:hypothetical protein